MIFNEYQATEDDWHELHEWVKQHMKNKEKEEMAIDFAGVADAVPHRQVLVKRVVIQLSYADEPDTDVADMRYDSERKTWAITGIPLYPRFVNLLTTLNDFIHSNNRNSRKD